MGLGIVYANLLAAPSDTRPSRWRISCSSHAAPDLFVVVAVRRHLLDINGRERHVLAVSLTRRSQSNGGAIYTEVLAG